jgi:hypothetical protein
MITMAPPFVDSDFDVIRVSDAGTVRRIGHSLLNTAGREGRECRATARNKRYDTAGVFRVTNRQLHMRHASCLTSPRDGNKRTE